LFQTLIEISYFRFTFQNNAERLLKLIDEVYRWLPLGTIVNNRVLVVHGGISDSTDLDLIRSLDRGKVSFMSIS
jgi:serine/threonine-protein phosphatase with EF-hands